MVIPHALVSGCRDMALVVTVASAPLLLREMLHLLRTCAVLMWPWAVIRP